MNAVQLQDKASIRRSGAVYTPKLVAEAIVDYLTKHLSIALRDVLEPSVGDGVFIDALSGKFSFDSLTLVDTNRKALDGVLSRFSGVDAEVCGVPRNFISYANGLIEQGGKRFDLIIGNPPFIRKHNFSNSFKNSLKSLAKKTECPESYLKNSWAGFVCAAIELLSDEGIIVFILPYELVTVGYGKSLLGRVAKICERVDIFIPQEKAFADIDQDAVLFVAQRKTAGARGVYSQRVKSLSELATAQEFVIFGANDGRERCLSLRMNSHLISESSTRIVEEVAEKMGVVGDFCTSAPGVVTAANSFFIMKESDALANGLMRYCVPVLRRSGEHVRSPVFSRDAFRQVAGGASSLLLKLDAPKSALTKRAREYILSGEKLGLHERYKCKNRDPWYSVPLGNVAPGFIFKRSHMHPRIIVNEALVLTTDTAYGINPLAGRTIRGICFSFYNSLTFLFSEISGRFYGGGVLELSPKEFRALPLFYHEPSDDEFEEFLRVAADDAGDGLKLLNFGDAWLSRRLAVSSEKLGAARLAWTAARAHRLRHGRPAEGSADEKD